MGIEQSAASDAEAPKPADVEEVSEAIKESSPTIPGEVDESGVAGRGIVRRRFIDPDSPRITEEFLLNEITRG